MIVICEAPKDSSCWPGCQNLAFVSVGCSFHSQSSKLECCIFSQEPDFEEKVRKKFGKMKHNITLNNLRNSQSLHVKETAETKSMCGMTGAAQNDGQDLAGGTALFS